MKQQTKIIIILYSRIINLLFWKYVRFKSTFSTKQKIQILLTDFKSLNWKRNIQKGFQNTKHEIVFKDIAHENIKKYDCVIPVSIDDLLFISEKFDLISNNPIPIPSKESILLCDDKYSFNLELIKKGFEKYIPPMGVSQTYPYILKKKVDVAGRNSFIISDSKQEQNYVELIYNPDYFTQELITGSVEYTVHILFKDQKIISSINIKYIFENDMFVKGEQDKPVSKRVCLCPYLETFSTILNSIGFEGLCNFSYKLRNNQPMIIELNPRCGYSLSPYLFSFVEKVL